MRWLLRRLLSDEDRRSIEDDLAELHALRRRLHGAREADRWLRRQWLVYPWHLLTERLRASVPRGKTMGHLWSDVRYSVRSLIRVPALFATIVLTVGVGLGATTAMIGVVRAVLVSDLPYADPGSLVWIYTDNPPFWFPFSVVDYRALEADHPAFNAVGAYHTRSVTLSGASVGPITPSIAVLSVSVSVPARP